MANRQGLGATIGTFAGAGLGGLAGFLMGGPVGGYAGAKLGLTAGGALGAGAGALGQSIANRNNPQYAQQGDWFKGSPGGIEQINRFNQMQQPYFQQLAQQGMQNIQNPYAGFEDIGNYARNNFQNVTIPSLAERFSSMGSNALSSPAFGDVNAQASKDLELGLAALRQQYGFANKSQGASLLGMGLTPQYSEYTNPGSQGFASQVLPQLIGPTLDATGAYFAAKPGQGATDAWSAILNGRKGN